MVPDSQAYMDLLSFEKRLDTTIARKRLEIQEAVKRPLKVTCNVYLSSVNMMKLLCFV